MRSATWSGGADVGAGFDGGVHGLAGDFDPTIRYYLNSLSPDVLLSPDGEFDEDRPVFETEFLEESALAETLGAR
ncbi:hypothetical protein [Actinoplanes philippinensis]|uniref:hypothetical protein n=1 Tax=Actinoplanes philippinensis TaxID=35752 RepID=UPI003407356A